MNSERGPGGWLRQRVHVDVRTARQQSQAVCPQHLLAGAPRKMAQPDDADRAQDGAPTLELGFCKNKRDFYQNCL
jgi:hypothetical protein